MILRKKRKGYEKYYAELKEMTVKELCKNYKCNRTSIYNKIKRHEKDLIGHIDTSKKIIELDDYAVDLLIPEKIKSREQQISEIAELKTMLYNEQTISAKCRADLSEALNRCRNAEKENSELRKKLESSEIKVNELERKCVRLTAEITELQSQAADLRKSRPLKIF